MWVRLWEYAYVLLAILYNGWWVQVFFPRREILPPAESEGLTDDHKVTHLLNLWPSHEAQTHIRGISSFFPPLWITSVLFISTLLFSAAALSLEFPLFSCHLHFSFPPSHLLLSPLLYHVFFSFFATSKFTFPSYVTVPILLELMTSVQTNEIIVLTGLLWRPRAFSNTIFETHRLMELAGIRRLSWFFMRLCYLWHSMSKNRYLIQYLLIRLRWSDWCKMTVCVCVLQIAANTKGRFSCWLEQQSCSNAFHACTLQQIMISEAYSWVLSMASGFWLCRCKEQRGQEAGIN